MTDDPTKDLTTDEMLRLILGRLDKLEAQSTGTTRPLLDQIVKEMVDTREMLTERMDIMNGRLDRIEKQLKIMTQDIMQVRTDQQSLEDRMDAMERRPN